MILKDWVPLVAGLVALIGVGITVRRARLSFEHGRLESRKDRQRDLVARLISASRALLAKQDISFMVMTKMTQSDLAEWVDTDSWKAQTDLQQKYDELIVHAVTEIADPVIRPIVVRLANEHGSLTQGDGENVMDFKKSDDERFESYLVILRRITAIRRIVDDLYLAAVQRLPVEIEAQPSLPVRLWSNLGSIGSAFRSRTRS